ncbi:MAG TPA: rhomboid family intramembrane serine protease, partial [Myxococcaceae bacterium]|nr:rhomboid family intramembrane serine protease [Myxococcaceae bacterium]
HIFFNMSAVYTLGAALERGLGTWRFALVSLATCLGSAAFALFFSFRVPTVGASGMILGWAGAMLPISTRAGRQNLLIWLVQVAVISLLPGVSWQGHLGGFLFGLPCGIALRAGARWFNLFGPLVAVMAAVIAVLAANPQVLAR